MECTLANGITTTTNGVPTGVQPYGQSEPHIVEIFGQAVGTSGSINVVFNIETSTDGSSFSAASTITLAGTFTSKPFAVQQKVAAPWVRINVTTISGTGAALYANCRVA